MVALLHVEFSMGRVARQTRPDPPARAGLTWGGGRPTTSRRGGRGW